MVARSSRKRAILAFVLAMAGLTGLFVAQPASAQGYICPSGPGPGERQIGMTPGGNGVASVPVCVSDGSYDEPQAPPPPQMRSVDNYFAAAWHEQSSDVWIEAGYRNEERARQAALRDCNQAMGGGCTIANSNVNGSLAIARGVLGNLYASSQETQRQADKSVLDYCRKQGDECVVINGLTTSPGSAPVGSNPSENPEAFPPRGNPRRQYGAVAWVDTAKVGPQEWLADVWLATGRDSAEKAKADALALCQGDMPRGCAVALVASDVYLAVTNRDDVTVLLETGASADLAKKRGLNACKQAKGDCRVTEVFSLGYTESYRHSPFAHGKSYFTAQAWIKGDTAPWQNSVWSVSGAKDEAGAKAAAMAACKKESGLDCELASSSFNSKVAIYKDHTGAIRLSWLRMEVDPAAYVAKRCAEAKVTCRLVKVIDSRLPAAERIEAK